METYTKLCGLKYDWKQHKIKIKISFYLQHLGLWKSADIAKESSNFPNFTSDNIPRWAVSTFYARLKE